jgi:hypothetical protein
MGLIFWDFWDLKAAKNAKIPKNPNNQSHLIPKKIQFNPNLTLLSSKYFKYKKTFWREMCFVF